jgi:hypothetical protein
MRRKKPDRSDYAASPLRWFQESLGIVRVIAFVLVAAVLNGCMTTKAIDPRSPAVVAQKVTVGDTVICTLQDGRQVTLTVTAVEADALQGATERIRFAEMIALERRQVSVGKTTLLTTGIVVVALGALVLYFLARANPSDIDGNDIRPR